MDDTLKCPITLDRFSTPVVDVYGHTYEKDAIERWISTHGTSPINRQPLAHGQIFPNRIVEKLLCDELQSTNTGSVLSTCTDHKLCLISIADATTLCNASGSGGSSPERVRQTGNTHIIKNDGTVSQNF